MTGLRHFSRYAGVENFGARERVALGVELLNARIAGWLDRLDMDAFSLLSSNACIAGQLSPEQDFDLAVPGWLGLSFAYAADVGIYAGSALREGTHPEYAALEAEWRRVIAELRAAARPGRSTSCSTS